MALSQRDSNSLIFWLESAITYSVEEVRVSVLLRNEFKVYC